MQYTFLYAIAALIALVLISLAMTIVLAIAIICLVVWICVELILIPANLVIWIINLFREKKLDYLSGCSLVSINF